MSLRSRLLPQQRPAVGLRLESLESRDVPAPFTAGNLVIYRVGDGSASLSSAANAVFLDEYSPSGALVQSVALPTADSGANQTLTASGTATSEGGLSLSSDGRYLVFGGYDAALGTASIAGTSTATVARVLGRAGADGTVDTSTTTTSFSGNNIRSVASTDGSNFWAAGATSGVVYQPLGGSDIGTIVSTTATNLRVIQDIGGQLYVSSGSGTIHLGTVGTGSPTTTGQTLTALPGFPTSGSQYGYFFADLSSSVLGLDTLYVASDDAGGLQKYSLVSGSWASNGLIGASADAYRGLTATVSGGAVTLYATRKGGSGAAGGGEFVSLVDASGYNGAFSGTPTLLATAVTNTSFRGVAFVPQAASAPTVTSFNPSSGSVGSTVTLTGTGFTGATGVTFNGTAASSFTVVSATQITAVVPAGASTGAVSVTTPGGTGTSATNFTVTPAGTAVIANRVFIDADANGAFNTGDTGVDNVAVKLYADTNANGTYDAGTDPLVATTNTSGGGKYSITGLAAGTYFISADATGVAALNGYTLSGAAQPRKVVLQPVPAGITSQYDFNAGDLTASYGPGQLTFLNASTSTKTQFGSTTSFGISGINGVETNVMKVPGTANAKEGYRLQHGAPANGGSSLYLNQYTFVADIYVPDVSKWTPLFNTNLSNANDGDAFIRPAGSGGGIGISGNYAGTINANTWYRVTITIDSSNAGKQLRRFIDGAEVGSPIALDSLDGRWAAYLDQNGGNPAGIILFGDDDTDVNAFYVSSMLFTDRVLSDAEIAALGAPDARGIVAQSDFTQGFAYVASAPTVTSFNPSSGSVGSTVTLTGTGFTGATGVTFNGTAASSFTVVSATQITVTVPAGASTGAVSVTTPAGTGTSTTNFTVTAAGTPSVTDAVTDEDTQTTSGLVITANATSGDGTQFYKITGITNGTLFKNNGTTAINDGDFITKAEGAAGLKFTPGADFFGAGSFQIQASTSADGSGLGGSAVTATITVNAVNDAPVNTVPSTSPSVVANRTIAVTGISVADADANTDPVSVTVSVPAGSGAFAAVAGGNVTVTGSGTEAIILTGSVADLNAFISQSHLSFTAPAAEGPVAVTVRSTDHGSTGAGGELTDTDTFTITVTPQPTVALLTNLGSISEVGGTVFLTAFISAPSTVDVVVTLNYGGTATLGDDYTAPATIVIPAGQISGSGAISAIADGVIEGLESISVTIASANFATPDAAAVVVNVTDDSPSNLPPVNTVPGPLTTDEDVSVAFTGANTISVSDPDDSPGDLTVVVSVPSDTGTLTATGAGVTGSGTSSLTFTGTAAQINAALATLVYIPTPDGNVTTFDGAVTLRIVTTDSRGGTAEDGVAITVTPVDDLPTVTATGANAHYFEDDPAVSLFSGAVVSAAEPGESIDQIVLTVQFAAEPGSELIGIDGTEFALTDGNTGTTAGSGLTVTVQNVNDVWTITVTKTGGISESAAAAVLNGLTYRNASQNPSSIDRQVTIVSVRDTSGATSASPAATATVHVFAVNDAPVLTGANDFPPINEDQTGNPGVAISDLLIGHVNDVDEPGLLRGLALTGIDTTNGTWEYTADGSGLNWLPVGAVSATQALLLNVDPSTRLRFVPNADFNGTVTAAVSFRAWDQTSGLIGTKVDVSVAGGTTAFSLATGVSNITVNPVNDAPTVTVPSNQTIGEDGTTGALPFTVGDAETATAALTVTATSSNQALVPDANIVLGGSGASRTVTVTPVADQSGTVTITLTVSDGTSTTSQTFTVTVNAVNDAPSLALGVNQTVAQGAGAQTRNGFATFTPGGGSDEAAQTATYTVTNSNNALFSVQPSIAPNGTLTFTPAAGASGTATVTVVAKDNGGTANGGIDTSASRTFVITVATASAPTPEPEPGEPDIGTQTSTAATAQFIAIGTDAGALGTVRVLSAASRAPVRDIVPFQNFFGGVKVALGDVNGDGKDDLIVGAATQSSHVKVFDIATGAELYSFLAFTGFTGGVDVAAGDVNGDGKADIVVGSATRTSHVKVFSGATGAELASFLAFPGFAGGIKVAAGDVTGDGKADIAVLAGPGGNGHIKVFNGATGALVTSFLGYTGYLGEIDLAVGDADGNGVAEVITAAQNPINGTHIKAFNKNAETVRSFFAPTSAGTTFQRSDQFPVPIPGTTARLGVADVDGDGVVDYLLGSQPSAGVSRMLLINGKTEATMDNRLAFDPIYGLGIYVEV